MPLRPLGARRAAVAACVVAAVGLRLIAALRPRIIESDGAYYASLAAALLRGDPAHGLSTVWPPLYPFLVAAAAGIARLCGAGVTPESLEGAARAVSVIAGLTTLPLVYRIARLVWGEGPALLAMAFAAIHPRLVQYSGAALTEATFTALLTAGVAAWCARQQAMAGASLGLAALARPEGLALAGALWLAGLFASEPWTRRLRPAFVAAFLIVILPYVAFVTLRTGSLSLGEKGAYNFWRAYRVEYARVLPEPEGLSEHVVDGPELAAGTRAARVDVVGFIARTPGVVMRRTATNLARIVASSLPLAIYPVFAVLLLLGAWRTPWARAWPVGLPIAASLLLYAPFSVDRRFLVPVVPLALVLATGALEPIARRLAPRRAPAPVVVRRVAALGLLVVAGHGAYALLGVRPIDDAPEHRAAGLWLREWSATHWPAAPAGERGRPIVMSRKPWVAHYSGGVIAELPDGDLATVARRVRETGADILVVDARWGVAQRPALERLLRRDVYPTPPGLLYSSGGSDPLRLYDARALFPALRYP